MTVNSSVSYFILTAYIHVGSLRYLCFLVAALLYVAIVFINTSLIVVICVNRSLHEPMYMFLCSLFVNELYGSTGLFPLLLVQILSDVHSVPASLCFLQIYCIYTYGNVEVCNLAVMSYDRYVAICHPLQYSTRMTPQRAALLILGVWLYSLLKFLITLSLNVRLTHCGNAINSLYCQNYLVVKLACSDARVNNVYGLFAVFVSIIIPLIPIMFSYTRILQVCFSGCKQTRQKAVTTCTPHIVSLLNFSFGSCFEIFQSRFSRSSLPVMLRLLLSLYFLIIQPLLNPVMYGMQMSRIRRAYQDLICCRTLRILHRSKLKCECVLVLSSVTIFCLYTYGHVEFCNLAVMSYDRYVAICHPLQYSTRMTLTRAAVCISLPLLNPVMYGMQLSRIRQTYRHVFWYKVWARHRDGTEA
ncbi:olfactory receptor 1361-like [Stegastes partitus]|uniref:Olfactory receptor 1361-like n=1 Tax=Stegastes partitus TaxID=144197 RepID=A0A9Y4NQB3_9TELE|nr:PREDICTED: olfactory receptor 1361-like [Stegastes partitus]